MFFLLPSDRGRQNEENNFFSSQSLFIDIFFSSSVTLSLFLFACLQRIDECLKSTFELFALLTLGFFLVRFFFSLDSVLFFAVWFFSWMAVAFFSGIVSIMLGYALFLMLRLSDFLVILIMLSVSISH